MTEPLPRAHEEQAAQLLAEGRYSQAKIAEMVSVDRKTLFHWRQDPVFASRVDHLTREIAQAAKRRGIARKDYRIGVLADIESNLRQVMEARAVDMAEVPGGETGLLVRKSVVSAGVHLGYEYAVDTGMIAELRRVQEQVAKELGQLVEKHEHKVRSLKDLTDDELSALVGELAEQGEAEAGAPEGDRPEE